MSITRLVVVAGLSGAGKSQAMKSFEDLGYSCVDNLPPAMLDDMLKLATAANIQQLAVAPDVRTLGAYGDAVAVIDALKERGVPVEVLFLDASDEVLVRRYSETRRRHPFSEANHVSDAIRLERASLAALRLRADRQWNTSQLTYTALKAKITEAYHTPAEDGRLAVSVIAFGFKYGLPLDADLVFDVRFLENPNYVPELKALSGADAPVATFLEALPETEPFVAQLKAMLEFLLPQYLHEGKSHLTIGIGCTGGRHRSVYIARRVTSILQNQEHISVAFQARDLGR